MHDIFVVIILKCLVQGSNQCWNTQPLEHAFNGLVVEYCALICNVTVSTPKQTLEKFLLLQALEKKLQRADARCKQLELAERHARSQHDVLQHDKHDITEFLKNR